jgi:leucine-rich repeat kinase 2
MTKLFVSRKMSPLMCGILPGKVQYYDFVHYAANTYLEIYYTTHQFFLSERSIYLVVWNLLEGIPFPSIFFMHVSFLTPIFAEETASRIEFWLQSINARANGAGVIVVGTHADEVQRGTAKTIIKSMREK